MTSSLLRGTCKAAASLVVEFRPEQLTEREGLYDTQLAVKVVANREKLRKEQLKGLTLFFSSS